MVLGLEGKSPVRSDQYNIESLCFSFKYLGVIGELSAWSEHYKI